MKLYDEIVDPTLLVRRVNIVAGHVVTEAGAQAAVRAYGGEYQTAEEQSGFSFCGGAAAGEQLDMFTDYAAEDARREAEDAELEEERRMQEALLAIKQKFGKNAVLKGANLEEGATAMQRNKQIGGHRA
jgi:DNA polymerase V